MDKGESRSGQPNALSGRTFVQPDFAIVEEPLNQFLSSDRLQKMHVTNYKVGHVCLQYLKLPVAGAAQYCGPVRQENY